MQELLQAGREVGKRVRWQDHAQCIRQIDFFDPKADEVLELSATQARSLYDTYSGADSWVETLEHHAEFVVRIDKDWSVTYERISKLSVKGKRSVFISRFRLVFAQAPPCQQCYR